MRLTVFYLLALVCLPLMAQPTVPRSDSPVTDGVVNVVREDSGTVYIAGDFSYVGPATGSAALIDRSTGTVNGSFPAVDGTVFAIEPDGGGGWFIGGDFTSVGGVARAGLAHVDASFNLVAGFQADVNGPVYALHLSGANLFVGGSFDEIDAQSRLNIARVDATSGNVHSFNPQPDDTVRAITSDAGTIYFGGDFQNVATIARENAAATDNAGALLAWNPELNNGAAFSMHAQSSRVFMCGEFFGIGGSSSGNPVHDRRRFAVVDAGGTGASAPEFEDIGLENTAHDLFMDGNTLYVVGTSGDVRYSKDNAAVVDTSGDIAPQSDSADDDVRVSIPDGAGGWYIGGLFMQVGGVSRPGLARVGADGQLDTSFAPTLAGLNYVSIHALALSGSSLWIAGTATSASRITEVDASTGAVLSGWSLHVSGGVVNALLVEGTELFVGGDFTQLTSSTSGSMARNSAASVNLTNGAITTTLTGTNSTGEVHAFASDGTNLYVGGQFIQVNGSFRNHLAAVALSTGAVLSWNPNVDDRVNVLETDGTTLYAGGLFLNIGTSPRSRIASWDTATLTLSAFNPGPANTGEIHALRLDAGLLYIGGLFDSVGGISRDCLARVDASSGLIIDTWHPMRNAQRVWTISATGTSIFVGGDFNTLTKHRSGCVAFDIPTQSLLGFDADITGGVAKGVTVQSGTVYLTGSFTQAQTTQRMRLAAYDTNGSLQSFQSSLGGDGEVIVSDSAWLLVGGAFASAGGSLRTNLAAFDATTRAVTAWTPIDAPPAASMVVDTNVVYVAGQSGAAFDRTTAASTSWTPATDGSVNAMVKQGANLYLGGSFNYLGRFTRSSFAVLDPASAAVDTSFPSAPGNGRAIASDGAGGWYVGGVGYLVHYLANGMLDTGFTVSVGNDSVDAMALDGGKLFIAGSFDYVNGQPRERLAAVDATTGAVDSWNPGADNSVTSLHAFGGRLYVLGNFSNTGGQPRNDIASFDISTGNLTSWNPVINGSPRALAYDGTWLYLGGGFSMVSGVSRPYVCQISPTSSMPSSWVMDAPNGFIHALEVEGTTLFMGGNFDMVGAQSRENLASYDITGQNLNTWAPVANNWVMGLEAEGTDLYIIGNFTQLQGQSRLFVGAVDGVTGNLLSWNPAPQTATFWQIVSDGSSVGLVGSFSAGLGGTPRAKVAATDTAGAIQNWSVDLNDDVHALAADSSRVYMGGQFTTANAQVRRGVAAADPTTGALDTFDADVYGTVRALSLDGSDLYLAGEFRTVGGQARSGLAVVDSQTGVVGINPTGFSPQVHTVFYDQGLLYLGGTFTYSGDSAHGAVVTNTVTGDRISTNLPDMPERIKTAISDGAGGLFVVEFRPDAPTAESYRIRRVLATGGFDTNFSINANGSVETLLLVGTKLFAGGAFTELNAANEDRLARIEADSGSTNYGQPDSVSFYASSTVYSLETDGTSLFVGGQFSQLNGNVRRSFGAYTLAGLSLNSVASGSAALNSSAIVRDMHVSGGLVYVAGTISSAGGSSRDNAAAWNISAGNWTAWAPDITGAVHTIWMDGLTAYVGGLITEIDGQVRDFAGAINADPASAQFGNPTSWAPTVDGQVMDMRVVGTDVLVAGSFEEVNAVFRGGAAVLDSATAAHTGWSQTFNDTCTVFLPAFGGYLVGGNFTITGQQAVNRICSMFAGSGQLTTWRPAVVGAYVQTFDAAGSSIYAGGDFVSIGGVPTRNLAEFDSQPIISTPSPLPDVFEGVSYGGQFIQASGGLQPYSWSIANGPTWLNVDANTGELTGNAPSTAPATVTFDITVTDQNTDIDTKSFSFDLVAVPALSILTTSPLADQYEANPVTGLIVQAQGGAPAYQWSLQNAPGWLGIDINTGQLTGTVPSAIAPTTISFDVVVSDQVSQVDTRNFSFDVLVYATLQITTTSLPDGYPGVFYSGVFVQATGGATPYDWSISGGPPWLAIDQATGELTGTVPTGALGQTFNFNLTVTDAFSNFVLSAFSIDIVAIPQPVITTTTLPDATYGSSYQATLAASGGSPAYVWSIGNGPTWIHVNPSTGELTGTPPLGQLGTFDVEVSLVDSFTQPQQASASLTLTILDSAYSGSGDTWENKPNLNAGSGAPAATSSAASVSTGSQLFVWGGSVGSSTNTNQGGMYDVATDTWLSKPNLNNGTGAPPAAASAAAVWTGQYVIVWGGSTLGTYTNRGGVYDPSTDTWLSTPNLTNGTGAPPGRMWHVMLWTGSRLLIWGGFINGSQFSDGGVYDPVSDTWESKPNLNSGTGAPSQRYLATGAWTGSTMIVWGGQDGSSNQFDDGGIYELATDTWSLPTGLQTGASNAPAARSYHVSGWTGSRLLIWGGGGVSEYDDGGIYDPATDTWAASTGLNGAGRPPARYGHVSTYGNGLFIVYGGVTGPTNLNTGGVYDAVADAWLATPNFSNAVGAPSARSLRNAGWVNSRFVVWGGAQGSTRLNDGGCYRAPSGGPGPALSVITIQATDPSAAEFAAGGQFGQYTLTLTPTPTSPVTIMYTMSGTADTTPAVDYYLTGPGVTFFPATRTVVVPGGISSVVVTLEPADDSTVEPTETAIFTIEADPGYTVGSPSSATVQIADNDSATVPDIIVTPGGDILEGSAGSTQFDLGLSIFAPSMIDVDIEVGGTAVPGVDYDIPGVTLTPSGAVWTGTVSVSAATSMISISIVPIDDSSSESDETVTLTVVAGTGYSPGIPASAQLLILNDDGGGGGGSGGGGGDDGGCSASGQHSCLFAAVILALFLVSLTRLKGAVGRLNLEAPKSVDDVTISDQEIATCKAATSWFNDLIVTYVQSLVDGRQANPKPSTKGK